MRCLRCNGNMDREEHDEFQHAVMPIEVFVCRFCGKIEIYRAGCGENERKRRG